MEDKHIDTKDNKVNDSKGNVGFGVSSEFGTYLVIMLMLVAIAVFVFKGILNSGKEVIKQGVENVGTNVEVMLTPSEIVDAEVITKESYGLFNNKYKVFFKGVNGEEYVVKSKSDALFKIQVGDHVKLSINSDGDIISLDKWE